MSRGRDHHDALSSGIGSMSMSSREDSTGGGGGGAGHDRHIEKLSIHQAHPSAVHDRYRRQQHQNSGGGGGYIGGGGGAPITPPGGGGGSHGNYHYQQQQQQMSGGGGSGKQQYHAASGGGGGAPITPPGGGSHGNYQQQISGGGGSGKQQYHAASGGGLGVSSSVSERHHHHQPQQHYNNPTSHYNGVVKSNIPPLPPDVHLEPTSPTATGGPLDRFMESPPLPLSTTTTTTHHHQHHHQQQQHYHQQHPQSNSTGLECSRPAQGFSEAFERLRSECRRQGILFSDASFPAADSSLFFSRQTAAFPVTWMRPAEIARQYNLAAEFRAVTHHRGCDLKHGDMGDCWLVDSMSCLLVHDCDRHQLLHRVVPPGQSFSSSWYAGLFCFRFWRCGAWQEVIVDDLLPTRNGRAIYVHSEKVNEFWGALLEKAYAKLNGCYEALKGGLIGDAMTDVTGGLTELYSLEYASSKSILPPKDIDDVLIKAFDRHSLVGAGISDRQCPAGAGSTTRMTMANGLVAGHAYALTDTRKIRLKDEGGERLVTLVRLRNPWSSIGVEMVAENCWSGAWSERSEEWRSIPQQDRVNVGLVKGEGEFWMSLEDFLSNFDTLYLCHLPPSLSPVTVRLWTIHEFQGCWRRGVTAGGRPYLRHLHWTNPQYRLVLGGPDPGDPSDQCSFLVGLMQRERRSVRHRPPPLVSIGFIIYKLPSKSSCPLPRHFFERSNWLVSVDYFVNAREVVKRFRLPPGAYVLVPCTYEPDQEANFLIRIYFEHGACTADYPEGRLESFIPPGIDHPGGGAGPQDSLRSLGGGGGGGWLRRFFTDEAGEVSPVDAFQLQRLLNIVLREEQFYTEISVEACKSLVSLVDCELTFRVTEADLTRLWPALLHWIRIFRQVDVEGSGAIPIIELRNAFNNLGYYVPPKLVLRLSHRYADPNFRISFSNFVSIMALLKKVFDSFKKHDSTGKVVLSLEEYFEVALLL